MNSNFQIRSRLARIGDVLRVPIIGVSDQLEVADKCYYCKKAYEIGRQLYNETIKDITTSDAMAGNTDIKVRHRKAGVYQPQDRHIRIRHDKEAYKSEIEIYSHDHRCHTLMIGIRSVYKLGSYIGGHCTYIIVEADIPYRKNGPLPL